MPEHPTNSEPDEQSSAGTLPADLSPQQTFLNRLFAPLAWIFKAIAHVSGRLCRSVLEFNRRVKDRVRRQRGVLTVAVLIVLLFIAFLLPHFVVRVLPGEAAVLYRLFGNGTVVDHVYGEGLHLILPWNHMYVYDVRVQETDHSVDLLTKNGLNLNFRLSIRYRPEYDMLGVLHKKVGPEYVEKIVVPQVVSVLRVYVGQYTAEDVYTTRRAILEKIFSEAIEQVAQNYITVNRVIIRSIVLPEFVQAAIDNKMEQKHLAEAYEFRLMSEQSEAKRRKIEATGFEEYNTIISKSLTPDLLKWRAIEATKELAVSENSKIIVIGNGDDSLPVLLGGGQ